MASLPPFSSITFNRVASNGTLPGEECKPEVAKTGLGSSAAMTTSVVAALLHYLGVVTLAFSSRSQLDCRTSDSDLDLVHIVAQSAHCLAQGKIGSGFDVSAAVYGSQRYIRFSPALLMPTQVSSPHLPFLLIYHYVCIVANVNLLILNYFSSTFSFAIKTMYSTTTTNAFFQYVNFVNNNSKI